MAFNLSLVEGEGYILEGDSIPLGCGVCGEALGSNFYWCRETGRAFCDKCQRRNKTTCRVMLRPGDAHIHERIIGVNTEDKKDEKGM